MTDSGTPPDLASLAPLEPLDGAAPAVAPQDPMAAQRAGMPAPAFNMHCSDKTFYRFLFAGVVMFVGCMMPFSAEINRAGYQSMAGGFYLLIAIAMIWSWWASIANNRPVGLKWLLLSMFPLIGTTWTLVVFDPVEAADRAREIGMWPTNTLHSESWGEMFKDMWAAIMKNPDAPLRLEGFWRLLGPGTVLVFLGSLIAEVGFIMGVSGGMKKNKEASKQKQMRAAERRRK